MFIDLAMVAHRAMSFRAALRGGGFLRVRITAGFQTRDVNGVEDPLLTQGQILGDGVEERVSLSCGVGS
ncbi:hypothetical protein ASG92_01080 [Arthrobacter sp. Soil736]|nr:hypothetical protein ASG92_01080 [Arthrobacter sp. Soil736]